MIHVLRFLLDSSSEISKTRKKAVAVFLLIGYLTSMTEIQRNVSITFEYPEQLYINEGIYSFGDIKTTDEPYIENYIINQYMPTDFENSFL